MKSKKGLETTKSLIYYEDRNICKFSRLPFSVFYKEFVDNLRKNSVIFNDKFKLNDSDSKNVELIVDIKITKEKNSSNDIYNKYVSLNDSNDFFIMVLASFKQDPSIKFWVFGDLKIYLNPKIKIVKYNENNSFLDNLEYGYRHLGTNAYIVELTNSFNILIHDESKMNLKDVTFNDLVNQVIVKKRNNYGVYAAREWKEKQEEKKSKLKTKYPENSSTNQLIMKKWNNLVSFKAKQKIFLWKNKFFWDKFVYINHRGIQVSTIIKNIKNLNDFIIQHLKNKYSNILINCGKIENIEFAIDKIVQSYVAYGMEPLEKQLTSINLKIKEFLEKEKEQLEKQLTSINIKTEKIEEAKKKLEKQLTSDNQYKSQKEQLEKQLASKSNEYKKSLMKSLSYEIGASFGLSIEDLSENKEFIIEKILNYLNVTLNEKDMYEIQMHLIEWYWGNDFTRFINTYFDNYKPIPIKIFKHEEHLKSLNLNEEYKIYLWRDMLEKLSKLPTSFPKSIEVY